MAEIIDSHHHLWRYDAGDYGWITPAMEVLKQDFLTDQLGSAMAGSGVKGSIVVQARQGIEETRWLLDAADHSPALRGVVGWLPLASPELPDLLRWFKGRSKLKGVRHVVQDEPDGFLMGDAFNAGVRELLPTGLVYDLLVYGRQLPQALRFVERHPEQVFVLDHCGKPDIRRNAHESWRRDLLRLGSLPNVRCKVSGLVTETAGAQWTLNELRPYLDVALEAFGAHRLMAGSDWPVCLLASTYERWWAALAEWTSSLSTSERDRIFGETATDVYGLSEPA